MLLARTEKSYRNYERVTNLKEFNWQSMQDQEMIRYRSYRLCNRDIRGDISTHGITLQVLAPGFWKILLAPVIMYHVCFIIRWCHFYSKHILYSDNSLMLSYQYLYNVMKRWVSGAGTAVAKQITKGNHSSYHLFSYYFYIHSHY